eukprot:TRINITY_DN110_c0_g2_i1.p2 TRINITY_DN110_c0_g2~~TRINITY_DN110_c0_g2_i1.p2  ORF type:complete len:140 (-),score=34.61 TRINITY_DN110_c0_g2_i1:81-476(-)
MSAKCLHCSKTVYHAEKREHDGKTFHARCFNLWKKACEEAERDRKNRENYDIQPDVSPAYYRVGDPSSGENARMVSGNETRVASGGFTQQAAPVSPPQVASGGSGAIPKFCPECGAATSGGKFCGECGYRF